MHWAAKENDAEAVKIALAGGADASAVNNLEHTPLDLARENGFSEVIGILANAQLQTALLMGQGPNKGKMVLQAIRGGVTDFSLTDKFGRTALHWAAMKDDAQGARIALAGGADPKAINNAGQTPLELAGKSNAAKVVALLSAPIEIAAPSAKPPKPAQPSASKTPPVAAKASSAATASNKQLQTALMSKGPRKAKDVLDAIRGGATDFSFTDQADRTALHWAARQNDVEAARIVLEGGADVNARSNLGQTALELARASNSAAVVALLSSPTKETSPSVKPLKDPTQQMPMSVANQRLQTALRSPRANRGQTVVRAIEGGATDFSLTDDFGRTALHWAVEANDLDAVQKALKAGADVNATANNGQTPLGLADERKLLWVARELKKYNAK